MLKYTGKYWLVLAPIVKKSLKKHYGKFFADKTMIKANIMTDITIILHSVR